jgi:para-aminobenzoate synthetase component 1
MSDWLWLQRSLPENMTGADLWEALYADEPITVLLESPATVPSKLARYSIAAGKPRQVWTPEVGEILPCLEKLRSRMQSSQNPNSDLPTHLPSHGKLSDCHILSQTLCPFQLPFGTSHLALP